MEDTEQAFAHYIEGLEFAVESQLIVRGLELLLAAARVIQHDDPCVAHKITVLIQQQPSARSTTRTGAAELQASLSFDPDTCDEEIPDWQQLVDVIVKRYGKKRGA
jgi:hypothetical protein